LLRSERIRQGLELKDIEHATSIRELYLNAVEEGNHKIAPGEVYLKGFIRNYSIHLGLDPQEVLELYRKDKEALTQEENPSAEQPASLNINTNDQSPPRIRKYKRRDVREEETKKSGSSFLKWAIVFFLAAGVAVWGAAFNFAGLPIAPSQPEPKNTPTETKPSVESNTNTNTANATVPAVPNPPPVTAPVVEQTQKNVILTLKFNGRSWTQVSIDGKIEYEGTPRAGDNFSYKGERTIAIRLGNAGVVEVTHNDKVLGLAGGPGEVIARTFTQDRVIQGISR
jgi:cytoskeletal protein RodZ